MLVGVQPTGRSFEVQHIHMYQVLDGKITEHFANRDGVGMMRQLGLLPRFRRREINRATV
jgi:predicted ester cyclase